MEPDLFADIEVVDPPRPSVNGHGGARRGAGRKPNDYVPTVAEVKFEDARARNEVAKAALNEFELKVKSGQYLLRTSVQQAAATAIASFAQTMRSVPDNLERTLGVSPEVAEAVSRAIDSALEDLASEFKMMAGPEPTNDV